MDESFITPPQHIHFKAKQMFGKCDGSIVNGSVAYIEPNGGGPVELHSHAHRHLFIVIKGEVKIQLAGDDYHIIHTNESYIVESNVLHSMWNNGNEEAEVIGITLE